MSRRNREFPKTKNTRDLWSETPDLVRRFLELRPDYEQLCNEVAYVLRKRLKEKGVMVASITSRAKTLNSYLEKLKRKTYQDPLNEITDFAGTRVVCLYVDDLEIIQRVIEDEFQIIEAIDKVEEKDPDQFGYLARHFIVRLGDGSSGARYDDLKQLCCEIQTRTVLQDAWAIIQHHLAYKRESQIPNAVQRKLNSLAGLFETADDQFQRVRAEREKYIHGLQDTTKTEDKFLSAELNLDSFTAFLERTFPDRPNELWGGQDEFVFDRIHDKLMTLANLSALIQKHEHAVFSALERIDEIEGKTPANVIPFLAYFFEYKPDPEEYGIALNWDLYPKDPG